MATVYCKYHRSVPARHRCPSCAIAYCTQCVRCDNPDPRCTVCGGELESLGVGNTIQPFWRRIPRIFAYPAEASILAYLGLLSVASIFLMLPLIGLVVALAIVYLIVKHGYIILDDTAQGNLTPARLSGRKLDQGNDLPVKQLGIFIIMAVAVKGLGNVAEPLANAAMLFFLLAVPASVIVLATTESFLQALNPLRLAWVMQRIGWPYLLLYVFLFLLWVSAGIAQEMSQLMVPGWLSVMVGTFISGYFTFIMFHLMGYVVYQYHEALGYTGVREFEAEHESEAPAPGHPVLNEVDILLAEGKTEEARQRLAAATKHSNETALHARYHTLLLRLGDKQALTEHARRYIPVLMERQERAKALDMFAACSRAVPGFGIDVPHHTLALAEFAFQVGRYNTALHALSGFARRFPDSGHIPTAYLLAAKLLCEHKSDLAQAKQVLRSLIAKYPDHPLGEEIRGYLSFVEGLEGEGAKPA